MRRRPAQPAFEATQGKLLQLVPENLRNFSMRLSFSSSFSYVAATLLSVGLFTGASAALAQQVKPAQPAKPAQQAQPAQPPQPPLTPAQITATARAAPAVVGDKLSLSKAQSYFARWGLVASDFSLLDDEALRRKAGPRMDAAKLTAAADAGDVVAMYLAGIRLSDGGDLRKGQQYIQRAAEHGLVRAISEASAVALIGAAGDADRARGGYEGLRLSASTGNAASCYLFGRVLLTTQVGRTWGDKHPEWTQRASEALLYSAQAGFAPAIVTVAKLAFAKLAEEGEKPELRKFAEANLAKAVAMGNAEAIAYQQERAAAAKAKKK